MRKMTLAVAFAVLVGVFCTGNTGKQTSSSVPAKWPKEALSPLSEDELDRFVKSLPSLGRGLKAAKWETKPQREGTSPLSTLTDLVEGMKVPGIDDSLKPYGGWSKIRPTLYRVYAASAALVIDRASPEMVEQMRRDTTPGGKKSLQDYEFFKSACTQVPTANKQLVARYQEQLQPLGSLGH